MKRTIKQWGFVGLVLCCGAASGVAGDSVSSQFNGWTVTITPRRPVRVIAVREQITTNRTESSNFQSENTDLNVKIVPIQQVSMRQNIPAPEPVTVPEDVLPRTKVAPEPVSAPATAQTDVVPQPAPTPQYGLGLPIITPRPRTEPLTPQVFVPQTALYRDIYFSIPFNRAEYDANPSYRHDATMELLFNQMRPTVIQRGTTYVNQLGMNSGYGFPSGFPYTYPYQPYYPFSYGLRVHRNP